MRTEQLRRTFHEEGKAPGLPYKVGEHYLNTQNISQRERTHCYIGGMNWVQNGHPWKSGDLREPRSNNNCLQLQLSSLFPSLLAIPLKLTRSAPNENKDKNQNKNNLLGPGMPRLYYGLERYKWVSMERNL